MAATTGSSPRPPLADAENLERLTYLAETLTNAVGELAVVARRALQTRSFE